MKNLKTDFVKKYKKRFIGIAFFCILLFIGGAFFVMKCGDYFDCKKDYQEVKTPSGLKIFFLKDERLPSIQYKIIFPKAGADYSGPEKGGLASLTAYLSEQGAGGLNSEKLQESLNDLGTGLSFFVNRQQMSITLNGLSWHGEKLWNIFEKVLSAPHFEEEEMSILRKQLLEQRIRNLDKPGFVSYNSWIELIFKGPRGEAIGGDLKSLSEVSLEDIKSFYQNQYLGGEPYLMVVGQYDKELKKKIISFFSKTFSSSPQKTETFDSSDLKAQFYLISNDKMLQASVQLGYPLWPFPSDEPRKFLVLQLANTILGRGGMWARLFKALRVERGLTYGAYSELALGKLYGFFLFGGDTKTDTVREFLEQTLVVLKDFRDKGIRQEELDRAKQVLRVNHLKSVELPEGRLSNDVYYNHYLALDPSFIKNFNNILEDISLEEVNRLIPEFVLSRPLQVLIYGHSSIESQLEGLEGFPPLKVISFEDYFKEDLKQRPVK